MAQAAPAFVFATLFCLGPGRPDNDSIRLIPATRTRVCVNSDSNVEARNSGPLWAADTAMQCPYDRGIAISHRLMKAVDLGGEASPKR